MRRLEALQSLHTACNRACITTRCKRRNCNLPLPGEGVVCIDCDRCEAFPSVQRRPDFVLLYISADSLCLWLIVEMKGGLRSVGHIVEQLQAGADALQNDGRFAVPDSHQHLMPLVLHTGNVRAADLARRAIRFLGRSSAVVFGRCGTGLETLLAPFGSAKT